MQEGISAFVLIYLFIGTLWYVCLLYFVKSRKEEYYNRMLELFPLTLIFTAIAWPGLGIFGIRHGYRHLMKITGKEDKSG